MWYNIVNKAEHSTNLTDDYVSIRDEMEAVAKVFGKTVLREVSEEDYTLSVRSLGGTGII